MAIIGRHAPADVVIANQEVSGRHAEIRALGGDQFQLTDLGSTNGTFVNGQRIQSCTIRLSDEVRLGAVQVDLSVYRDLIQQPRAAPVPQSSGIAVHGADRTRTFALATIGAAAFGLVGVGALVAAKERVVQNCEICGRRIFDEIAYPWQAADTRARAAKFRWCKADGDAPVTVRHISRCEYCNRVISVQEETAPRRESPQGSDHKAGFCSEQCRVLHTGRAIYREGKDVASEAIQKGAEGLGTLIERLQKR